MGMVYIFYPMALYFGWCELRADGVSAGAPTVGIHQYSHVTFGLPLLPGDAGGLSGFPTVAIAKYHLELAIIVAYTLATWWDVTLFYCTRPGDLYKFWAALVLWETASTTTSTSLLSNGSSTSTISSWSLTASSSTPMIPGPGYGAL